MSYDIQFGEFSTWFNAKEATIKLAEDPATALTKTPLPGASPPAAEPGPDWELKAPSMTQGGVGMGAGAALGALMGLATSDNDDEQPWKRALAMGLMTGALGLGAATAYASKPQDLDKPVHDSAARRFGRGATRAAKWGANVIPEAVRGVGEELGLINPGDPNVLQQLVEHLKSQGHNVTPEQVSQEISKAQATAKQPGMAERAGQFIGQVRKAPEQFMNGYRSAVGKPSATTSWTAGAGPIAGTSGPSPSVSPVAPRTTASEGSTSHGPVKSDATPGPLPDAKPAGQPEVINEKEDASIARSYFAKKRLAKQPPSPINSARSIQPEPDAQGRTKGRFISSYQDPAKTEGHVPGLLNSNIVRRSEHPDDFTVGPQAKPQPGQAALAEVPVGAKVTPLTGTAKPSLKPLTGRTGNPIQPGSLANRFGT